MIWNCTGTLTVSRLTGGVRLPVTSLVASCESCKRFATRKLVSSAVALVPEHVPLLRLPDRLGANPTCEGLNLLGAEAIDVVNRPRPFQVRAGAQRRAARPALPKCSSTPCSPASMNTTQVESTSAPTCSSTSQPSAFSKKR